MRQAGVYVLASLISGVSAALILASGPSYTEARSPQGTAYNVKRGQSTYNGCRAQSSCQIAYLNSVEDFCLWAPPQPALSDRNTEHTLVAWCMKSAHGTHFIPDGTISGARLVITPEYVQITGVGNLTNINVPADGVASASGEGDRVHGLVFTRAYGQLEQIYDWTSFVSQERFCFRACKPSATASTTCPRIYDSFWCSEDAPGSYDTGAFEDYVGDATEVALTLHQEVLAAPSHYSTRTSSGCTTRGTTSNAHIAPARRVIGSSSSRLDTRSLGQSTPLTSSIAPTTTDTATTITFPSFATSTLTTNSFTSSSTPVSFAAPTSTPYSHSYTHTRSHWHSLTHRHSRHRSTTSSASVSSSSYHSFTYSRPSSSTASPLSLLGDPSTTSSTSSSASSTPSFTLTFSTFSSSDPSSSATSTSTSTPTLSSTSTSSFPSSSGGTPSAPSELSSAQPSSSTPSSTVTLTSSLTSPSIASLTSSQSSDVPTFTTSLSSSSVPTTSPATSSTTFPNSQTQLGSQCPPASQVAVNAGSAVPSPTPLLPLILTILMVVISASVGVLVP